MARMVRVPRRAAAFGFKEPATDAGAQNQTDGDFVAVHLTLGQHLQN